MRHRIAKIVTWVAALAGMIAFGEALVDTTNPATALGCVVMETLCAAALIVIPFL